MAGTGGGTAEPAWGSFPLSLDPRDASSGDWDTESCQTLETQAAHTRCQCQRLSTFAVLAQPPKDLVSWEGSAQAGQEKRLLGARGHLWWLVRGEPG